MNTRLNLTCVPVDEAPRMQEIHRFLIPDDHRFAREIRWMQENKAVYIDPATVPGLSRLGNRIPKLLFGLCGRTDFPSPVAIVGTRRPDWYGKTMGSFLGRAVAVAGGSVISGGALGIDTLAHQGCLDAGHGTIVVFAGGLAMPHPPSNKALFKKIVLTGCIISELPPLVAARPFSFTDRNRIIAALGMGTIVVQAGPASGALVTGRWGLKIGAPVFALPADCLFDNGRGTNILIREGATPIFDKESMLTGLGLRIPEWPRASRRPIHGEPVMKDPGIKAAKGPALSGDEADIYELVSRGTGDIDNLCIKTQMPPAQVLSIVSSLEMKGHIKRAGGGRFIAVENHDLFA